MPDGQSRTLESRPFRNSKIKPTEKKKAEPVPLFNALYVIVSVLCSGLTP